LTSKLVGQEIGAARKRPVKAMIPPGNSIRLRRASDVAEKKPRLPSGAHPRMPSQEPIPPLAGSPRTPPPVGIMDEPAYFHV
jgi:hypothetical protein